MTGLAARGAGGWRSAAALLLTVALLVACSRWNWREVRSVEDGWSASFPDKSQLTERDVSVLGRSLPMRMQANGQGATLFAVGVMQLPPEIARDQAQRAALLAWIEDGLVRRFALRDVRRTEPALYVPPGRQLLAATAFSARAAVGAERRAGTIAARLFIVDDRLYQVLALGAEGELPPEVEDNFLASFRLLPR